MWNPGWWLGSPWADLYGKKKIKTGAVLQKKPLVLDQKKPDQTGTRERLDSSDMFVMAPKKIPKKLKWLNRLEELGISDDPSIRKKTVAPPPPLVNNGPVDPDKKWLAGSNRLKAEKVKAQTQFMKKIAESGEEMHHEHVSISQGHLIMKTRQAKGWTQKDLGMHISEKLEVVRDYESGKAIPNPIVIGKMERELGVKLHGPHFGQPIVTPHPHPAGDVKTQKHSSKK